MDTEYGGSVACGNVRCNVKWDMGWSVVFGMSGRPEFVEGGIPRLT